MSSDLPFRTGDIVFDDFFTDRAEEVERIRRAMRHAERLLVYGERRQGKSSAIRQASLPLRHEGAVVAWVDLWTCESVVEVLKRLVAGVPFGWSLKDRFQLFLAGAGLEPRVSMDPAGRPVFGLGLRSRELPDADARDMLMRVGRGLDELAAEVEEPFIVVLDEVQRLEQIATSGGGLVRGVIQESPSISWIMAGSVLSLVDGMIGSDGPLHGVPRLDIGPIPGDQLAPWIEDRMRTHGVEPEPGTGMTVVERAGPRTEHVVRLAQTCHLRGLGPGHIGPGGVEEAFLQVAREGTGAYEIIWAGLSPSRRAVLRAVAAGITELHAQATRMHHDLPTSASITQAVRLLRDEGHLAYADPPRMADPFFEWWVRKRATPGVY